MKWSTPTEKTQKSNSAECHEHSRTCHCVERRNGPIPMKCDCQNFSPATKKHENTTRKNTPKSVLFTKTTTGTVLEANQFTPRDGLFADDEVPAQLPKPMIQNSILDDLNRVGDETGDYSDVISERRRRQNRRRNKSKIRYVSSSNIIFLTNF